MNRYLGNLDHNTCILSFGFYLKNIYYRRPHSTLRYIKPPWTIKVSLFKDYRPDNEALDSKCFEIDWECGKYNNFVKNDEDRETLKLVLQPFYSQMRKCYKHHSSFTKNDALWNIGSNAITDIFSQMGCIDGKILTLSS